MRGENMANVTQTGEPSGSAHRWRERPRHRGGWRLLREEALCAVNDSRNVNRDEDQFQVRVQRTCVSLTSWSEGFLFWKSDDWYSSPQIQASVWRFTFISESAKKRQLLGHLHVASFQTCSTKRGKLTLGPCEIEYIPSRQSRWNEIILWLHRDDFTHFEHTSGSIRLRFKLGFHYDYCLFLTDG